VRAERVLRTRRKALRPTVSFSVPPSSSLSVDGLLSALSPSPSPTLAPSGPAGSTGGRWSGGETDGIARARFLHAGEREGEGTCGWMAGERERRGVALCRRCLYTPRPFAFPSSALLPKLSFLCTRRRVPPPSHLSPPERWRKKVPLPPTGGGVHQMRQRQLLCPPYSFDFLLSVAGVSPPSTHVFALCLWMTYQGELAVCNGDKRAATRASLP